MRAVERPWRLDAKRQHTLYVAGPMRGYPRFNFDAFEEASAQLRAAGFNVVSPAEEDLKLGFDPTAQAEFTMADYHEAMRRDVAILLTVDGIALLDNWSDSMGARAEVEVAKAIGIPFNPVQHWLDTAQVLMEA